MARQPEFSHEQGLSKNFHEEDIEEGESLLFHYSRRTLKPKADDGDLGKMIKYDVEGMMSWQALFQFTGTALSRWELWRTLLVYWFISIILAATIFTFRYFKFTVVYQLKVDSDRNLAHLATVAGYTTALLGFMIGLFVTTSLKRWWSLREQNLGGLHRAIGDINLFLAVRLRQPEDKILKDTTLRLLLLSHRLVFAEAQDREADEHLDRLIEVGLLTEDEKVRLLLQPRKAQIPLVWLDMYFHGPVIATGRVTEKQCRNLDLLVAQCRSSIGQIFAYINTQLPFQYVHLLSLSVLLSNLLIAVKCGLCVGRNLAPDTPTDFVYITTQVFQVVFVPFSYHAFLRICDELSNPFGDDFGDFPGYHFHCQVRNNCAAMHRAAENAPPDLFKPCEHKPHQGHRR